MMSASPVRRDKAALSGMRPLRPRLRSLVGAACGAMNLLFVQSTRLRPRCRQTFRRERNDAHAKPDRVENGIGESRADGGAGRFAGADWRFSGAIDQLDVDVGRFREGQDRIAHPVDAGHPGPVEFHFFLEYPTERLQNAALDLGANAVGINDLPAVVRTNYPLHADRSARALDRDFDAGRDIALVMFVVDVGHSAPARD